MTTKTVGSKYEATRDLDIAAVAKLVRADIKSAVASGALPAGKYGVRIERYSMGRSINIRVSDVAGLDVFDREQLIATERAECDVRTDFSPAAKGVLAQVSHIADAYNRRESDWSADYSNVRFHLSVDFDSAWERDRREAERFIARGFVVSDEMFPAASVSTQESWLESMGTAS